MSSYSFRFIGAALLTALVPLPALAGSSSWEDTEGGRLRIVTHSGEAATDQLRAALQIDLAPGWKTYWREPGSAGIPPQITISGTGVEATTVHFPVPERVDDPYGSWSGYTAPVSLPLTIDIADGAAPTEMTASVMLGICHDICIPVMADLAVPLGGANSIQDLVVEAAFASLSPEKTSGLSVKSLDWTDDGLLRIALDDASGGGQTEVFLSAGSDFAFKPPTPAASTDGDTVFTAEPLFDPHDAAPPVVTIAARSSARTIETTRPLPQP